MKGQTRGSAPTNNDDMNILHLLSWFPTPDDPTLGNFCVRMIDALPEECHSVILSVCDGKGMTKSFEVKEIKGAHHTHVQIYIRPPKINAIRKLKMLRMYQYGLKSRGMEIFMYLAVLSTILKRN